MSSAVLWLYGADAVGTSAVGWEVYSLLADAGEAVAYVDTDYLGFCRRRGARRLRTSECWLVPVDGIQPALSRG